MGSKGSKGDKPDEGKKKVKVKKPNPKYYVKVLMVGTSSSGKSTLAKQMKIVHCDGFTSEERENYRRILISNLVLALKELITHAQQWRIELACSDVVALFEQMDTFDALTPELVDNIKTLWEDPGNVLHLYIYMLLRAECALRQFNEQKRSVSISRLEIRTERAYYSTSHCTLLL
jgi:hypothetical protein